MRGDGFVMPDTKRVPSVFAALGLMFLAMAGRYAAALLGEGTAYLAALMGIRTGDAGLNALVSFYYYAFFMLLPMGIYLYGHRGAGEYIHFKPLSGQNALLCVLCGAAGVITANVVSVFWTDIIYALGLKPTASSFTPGSSSELALTIAVSAVIPAVCEELLCRGMVLSAYEDRGSRAAIIISAVWFTCLHASVEGLPAELLSGLMLGCVTVFTGSVFAGIIYHTVHKSVILILNYVLSSAAASAAGAPQGEGSAYTGLTILGLAGAVALYTLMKRLYKNSRDGLLPPEAPRRKDTLEVIVLVCLIALTAVYYLLDVLEMTVFAP